jgi:hypothetical protein
LDAFGDLRRLAYGHFDTLLQIRSGEKTRAIPMHAFFSSATEFAPVLASFARNLQQTLVPFFD